MNDAAILKRKVYSKRREFKNEFRKLIERYVELMKLERQYKMLKEEGIIYESCILDYSTLVNSFIFFVENVFSDVGAIFSYDYFLHSWNFFRKSLSDSLGVFGALPKKLVGRASNFLSINKEDKKWVKEKL